MNFTKTLHRQHGPPPEPQESKILAPERQVGDAQLRESKILAIMRQSHAAKKLAIFRFMQILSNPIFRFVQKIAISICRFVQAKNTSS